MIDHLNYRISFPSTGKAFSQSIDFKPGLTIIRGPNETGKSLIIEMIRYALFGVSALRADRSDYNDLDVNMTFNVRGDSYRVSRMGNKAFLNGKLAVGTAAVNRKILELLGFDLAVFDLACAAMQGDLDKLTKRMRPGDRRKMVEEVIGLDAIEEEEKTCRSEANSLKRLAESHQVRLVEPEPPVVLEQYESSDVLDKLYKNQLQQEAEQTQLLSMIEPLVPIQPDKPEFNEDVTEHETRRLRNASEREVLERTIRGVPSTSRTRQDIDRGLAFYEHQKRGSKPTYSTQELEGWYAAWQIINAVGSLVTCPNCSVEFDPTTSTVHTLPDKPPVSLREVERERTAHDRWRDCNEKLVDSYDLTEAEVKEQDYALSQAPYRDDLLSTLGAIPDLPSRAEEAERKRLYYQRLEVYSEILVNYSSLKMQWDKSRQRLAELPEPDDTLDERLKYSRVYEEQKRRYDADMITYTEQINSIASVRLKGEGYMKGAEALKEVRLEAKQHLVPSLSRVASHLLSEMTDGKRNKVEVDEEFEVVVDGQPVRTLSGSGISVVNLALRIALGQVLTQNVVPIFLADEIDHDMDPERAEATHASLKKLTKVLDKVIVVTHKDIDGDHVITLE